MSTTPTIDLERTLRLMDVADEMRRQERRVQQHLEQSDRDRIKQHLLQRYEGMGTAVDPALLDEAIDIVLAQQYRYKRPRPGLRLLLAHTYVRRRELGLRVGVPVLLLLSLGGGLFGTWTAARHTKLARQERTAENIVAAAYAEKEKLMARLDALRAEVAAIPDDERAPLTESLQSARQRLDETQTFFATYAPQGSAQHTVTLVNTGEVHQQAKLANDRIVEANQLADAAATRLQRRVSIDELLLRSVALTERVGALTATADVLDPARRLQADAERAVARQDETSLRSAVQELEELVHGLEEEYTLVVLKGRERDNRRLYLIVQAIDARGDPLTIRIRDEETGRTVQVREWGERVSQGTYDAIAKDYTEDNVIDDRVFGQKKRGQLDVERRYPDLGQITSY